MKPSIKFFIILSIIFIEVNFSSLNAQITPEFNYIPGTICKDVQCSNVDKTSERGSPEQIQNGSGSIATSYTVSACGLGFVTTTVRLHQRSFSSVNPKTGVSQPAGMSVTGLPACASGTNIVKAFLYVGGSGDGVAITATIINPLSVTNNYPMTMIGTHFDKCWGYVGTYNYRADVTSCIAGNGSYNISNIPTLATNATNDMDGATLFIIYRDPSQTYTGHFIIADGCIEGSSTLVTSISGFKVCGATNSQTNFAIISDLQQITAVPFKMNSLIDNYTLANNSQEVWNYITSGPDPATSGQTSATFGITTTGDCWNFAVAGMYYRTSCLVCVAGPCVLPIELVSFDAAGIEDAIDVRWETATEKNNKSFSVLRSDDGINFNVITTLPGSGNSTSSKRYNYIDKQIQPGKTYYYKLRYTDLKNMDMDAEKTVYAFCNKKNYGLDIFPNPSSNEVYVVSENNLNNVNIEILDGFGLKVKVINNVNLLKGEKFTIDVRDIINGCYQLVVSGNGTLIQKKVVTYK